MKTLFGERKSVKTLAFILALALILPLLPVMSVVGEETHQVETIVFTEGNASCYYERKPAGANDESSIDIWTAGSDDTINLGGGVWKLQTDGNDIKATYNKSGRQSSILFKVRDADYHYDYTVTATPKDGVGQSLSKNSEGYFILPATGWSNSEVTVTAKKQTIATVNVTNDAPSDIAFNNRSSLQAGNNTLDTGSLSAEMVVLSLRMLNAGKEPQVDVDYTTDGKEWKTLDNALKKATSSYDYTFDSNVLETVKSATEIEIKLSSNSKQIGVSVQNKASDGVSVTGIKDNLNYGDTLDFNVSTPAGKNAPVVKIEMGTSDVTKSATATPINGGYNYKLTNVTDTIKITINTPTSITHNLTPAESVDNRFTITYKQKGAGDPTSIEKNTIDEGNSLIVNVTPNPGYKVQNITVKASDSDTVLGSTTADTITVTNIRENVSVTVDVVPITITVKVNNGGDLNGSYVFKYGESGFNTDLISWGELPKSNAVFNKDKIDDLVKLVQGALNKNPDGIPTRFGFDFVETAKDSTKGWIIADESLKVNPNADVTITLTGNWTPNYAELFVLTTTTHYENGNNTLSFISKLAVSDSADDAAKAKYGSLIVNVHSFGVFFGEYPSSLNGDFTLMKNVRDYINDNKNQTSTQEKVTTNLWGANAQKGDVYFYSTNLSENLAEFQVSGNTITETFAEQRTAQRSGITWVEISVGEDQEHTIVIVGPATEYLGA